MCRKCSICPAQTSLSLFAPLLATFFILLAAKGHIFKKINFTLDPLGADVSANLCQDRFKMMAKRKFLYFICVLYCPVFLIMEPGKTWNQGLFFCLVHLPTTDKNTGPSVLAKLQSDDLWADLCPEILKHQGPTSLPAGQALLAPWETVSQQTHCIQGFTASKGQAHCVDRGTSCPLSACLTFDVCPFCVFTGSQMS